MARESQGLQIALIVFVMLTIVCGVVAFLSYRNYSEALVKVEQTEKDMQAARTEAEKYKNEVGLFKQKIGAAVTEDTQVVLDAAKKELSLDVMQSLPEAEHTYRKAVETLNNALLAANKSLQAEKDRYIALKASFDKREADSQQQIQTASAAAQKAATDLQQQRTAFTTERDDAMGKAQTTLQLVNTAKQETLATETKYKGLLDEAKKAYDTMTGIVRGKTEQLEKLTKPTFEVASGKIDWVDQKNRTVWINLGSSANLSRLTTFSIYDAKTSDVTRSERKGSIEVTDILGPSLAVARIVDEVSVSDPVMVGDLIHTPIWEPGQRKHFALVGFIDIDDDGKSDQDKLIKLIQMNGGVVDSKFSVQEGRREGAIGAQTNYLIRGTEPVGDPDKFSEEEGKADIAKAYKEAIKDWTETADKARDFAVKIITVEEFLGMAGYKADIRVMDYRNPHPQLLRTPAPEGGQKKSSGNVSPIFQPRNPPTKGPIGAY